MNNFQNYKLSDLAIIIMGQSPPGKTYNKEGIGLPFFQGRKDFNSKYPTITVYCSEPKKIAEKHDTLVSVRAPVGDVNQAIIKSCIGRGVAAIRSKNDNHEFIYYLMKHYMYQIKHVYEQEGTVFGALKKGDLLNLSISVPSSLKERKAIGTLLSLLDEKIELNHRMNEVLEQMAQAIFKSWFVDFEPFRDPEHEWYLGEDGFVYNEELDKEIPKGWEIVKFTDLAEHKKGDIVDGPFGSNLKSSDFTEKGIRIIHQENISPFKFNNTKRKYTSEKKANEVARSEAFPYDIVLTKMPEPIARATILYPFIGDRFIVMADVIRVRPNKEKTPKEFLLYLINSTGFRKRAKMYATGSTRPRISLGVVRKIDVIKPPDCIIQKYSSIIQPFEEKRENNFAQIEELTKLRDLLLPQLISGRLRIPNPEKFLEELENV